MPELLLQVCESERDREEEGVGGGEEGKRGCGQRRAEESGRVGG